MTYDEICRQLAGSGIENPEWDAALLLERFCGAEPRTLRLTPEKDYTGAAIETALRRRLAREPLQYLLGEWQFYRQTYEVSPACLIPRSDTEILVEEAIRLLPKGAKFADLCTGSGCIAVSVLAEREDVTAVAVDKFAMTLDVALRNAERQGVSDRMEAICEDVLSPMFVPSVEPLDAILCNPPYIPSGDISALAPEVLAEPRAALDGGADGLDFYRALLRYQTERLKENGFFLFEIGYDQAQAVTKLGRAAGFDDIRVKKDYGGNDRVVYFGHAGA